MAQLRKVSSFSQSKILNYPMLSHLSQQAQSQQDEETRAVMYFVIPPGETEESCVERNLGEMFQMAEAHFLNVRWIKDEECKDIRFENNGNILVFHPFDSPGFKYWETKAPDSPFRVEILGPHVLRYIFSSPDVLSFSTKASPTYTLAMRNMIISLSGFKEDKKRELEAMVRWMNGSICRQLSKAVTHVVTSTALTEKSIEAQKVQLPVMTAEWIRQVWQDNQKSPVEAGDRRYVKFACPIFYNVNICMSQISTARKNTLKAAVERLGGKCTPDMIKGTTNVLVVTNPEGEKYKFGRRWKLTIATPEWIESSAEQGRLLQPAHFEVRHHSLLPLLTSTPAHTLAVSCDFNDTGCSAIAEPSRLVVNETNDTMKTSRIEQPTRQDDIIEQMKLVRASGYLDGLRIFVVDYDKYDALKRPINLSGAVRLNHLSDGVTHIVVPGQKIPKSVLEKMREMDPIPVVVTLEWVLESAQIGSPADDEVFRFNEESFFHPPNDPVFLVPGNMERVSATRTGISHVRESSMMGEMPNMNSSVRSSVAAPTSNGDFTTEETADDGDETSDGTENTGDGTNATETRDDENIDTDSVGLLVGLSFYIGFEDKDEYKCVADMIENGGGELKNSNADVAILPVICRPADLGKGDRQYTKDWLFECLKAESLDIEHQLHHDPRPKKNKKIDDIMKDVVIAVSQYPSLSRGHLTEMVKAMGGRYQEVFSRKDSSDKTTLKSTHLICKNMETDKAKAAKRWNVPVVTADWVLDSFNENTRVCESNYDPAVHLSSSDDRTVYMPTPTRRSTRGGNVSTRSVYPPSTTKAGPVTGVVTKASKAKAATITKPAESTRETPKKDEFRVPLPKERENVAGPSSSSSAATSSTAHAAAGKKYAHVDVGGAIGGQVDGAGGGTASDEDSFLRTLTKCPTQEEIDRKMAEFQADFPYSDDSYQKLLDDVAARGVNLDDVSPMTSMEERRICNLDSSSPLLLGLPRQESRALKEHFEIALSRSPSVLPIKWKTPTSTPMREIVRRFNAQQASTSSESDSKSQGNSPRTSTPKSDGQQLRKKAAINRISFGVNGDTSRDEIPPSQDDDQVLDGLQGIRKLETGNKRPSDGSPPRDEDEKTSKRARRSSDQQEEDTSTADSNDDRKKKSPSPNENNLPGPSRGMQINAEKPSTSKKNNRMQALNNLIAESQANYPENGIVSPLKRRSGEAAAIPVPCLDENVHEEVERPHLSWVDGEEEQGGKKSTVKKGPNKPRIVAAPDSDPEPLAEPEGRKRSSRLKKTPSDVGGSTKPTVRRTRSRSKTRNEDAPYGHQPMNLEEDKKSKKKSMQMFPIHLPANPIFVLSSLSQEEKNQTTRVIHSLGGVVSKLPFFDPNCCALLTKSLVRSEKILGCIASGKYLIKYDYIMKCEEEQHFLPVDETHLWHEGDVNSDREKELATAAFHWLRVQKLDPNKKPMTGMKFFFLNAPDKVPAYERLVSAGGGEVVKSISKATIVICDNDDTPGTLPPGVECQTAMYLNTLILAGPSA